MSQNLSSVAVVMGALRVKVNLSTNTPLLPKGSIQVHNGNWMPCFPPIKFVLSYFLRSPSDQCCQIILKTDQRFQRRFPGSHVFVLAIFVGNIPVKFG